MRINGRMFGVARVRNDSGSASVKVCGGNPPRQLLDPPFPRFKRRAKTTQDWNRFVGTKDKLEIAVERKVSRNFSLSLSLKFLSRQACYFVVPLPPVAREFARKSNQYFRFA